MNIPASLKNSDFYQHLRELFPALMYKNYRYYFFGQLVSLIGTWLQTVAQGWLVWQLTKSPFMVGFITALEFVPVMLFSLFGGVLVDRLNKKHLLTFTQASSMIIALSLGSLVILDIISIPIVAIFVLLAGLVKAIDLPARQSLTYEMVGRTHLPSAVALNMGTFNAARVIGPAFAGILISVIGVGWAFILNGISFAGPLFALMLMELKKKVDKKDTQPILESVKQGFSYAFSHPRIKRLLVLTAITSIFGWSYTTILPVIAQHDYHKGAAGLGVMYSAAGIGALLGTFIVSAFHRRFKSRHLILFGSYTAVAALFLFSAAFHFYLALTALFFAGLGLSMQMAMVNATIQRNSEDYIRGRIMGIYSLFFAGMQPLGGLQIGFVSEALDWRVAIIIGAFILLSIALYLSLTLPKTMTNQT